MLALQQARPPYVIFETRSEEDRNASIQQGHTVVKEVDYAIVRQLGGKDTHEKPALEWLIDMKRQAERGSIPHQWAEGWQVGYDRWKQGQAAPVNGFPLKDWASITRARAENYAQHGVFTVEDLSQINEAAMQLMGMGARADRDKARVWLDSKLTHGNAEMITALRAEAADKDQRIKQLEDTIANQSQRMDQLERLIGEQQSPKGGRKG